MTEQTKSALIYIAAIAVGILLFVVLHHYATAWRGQRAIGGELLVLFMPLVTVNFFRTLISDIRYHKSKKGDDSWKR